MGSLLCYQNGKEVNLIISVQAKLEIHGDIKVAGLSRDLDEANVNKEILKAVIVKAQNQLITELCAGNNQNARQTHCENERKFPQAPPENQTRKEPLSTNPSQPLK